MFSGAQGRKVLEQSLRSFFWRNVFAIQHIHRGHGVKRPLHWESGDHAILALNVADFETLRSRGGDVRMAEEQVILLAQVVNA